MANQQFNSDEILEVMRDSLREVQNRNAAITKGLNSKIDAVKHTAIGAQRGLDQIRQAQKAQASARSILIKSIVVRAAAIVFKNSVEAMLPVLYPDNSKVAKALINPLAFTKAAQGPAMTSVDGWARDLTHTSNFGLIASIAPASVYAALISRGISIDLAGQGSIRFISRPIPTDVPNIFIGEGAAIPVRQLDFTGTGLIPHKAAVVSLFTAELAKQSTPAAEAIISQALQDDTSVQIDAALLDDQIGSTTRPSGLLYGVVPLTASDAALPADAAAADIASLASAFTPGAQSLTIIAAPAQAAILGLLHPGNGLDVLSSDLIPAGTVIAIDSADFASVVQDGGLIDVSSDATLITKTDPLAVSTGTSGAGAITDAPHLSLYQHDLFAIRLIEDIGWQMRRAGRVQMIEGVSW
jgi:hypothetical protein